MTRGTGIARRVGANLARAGRQLLARASLPRGGGYWLSLHLPSPLEELPLPRLSGEAAPSLLDALETLDAAAADPDVAGVLLRLDGSPGGLSKALSLRRAVEGAATRGKPVVVYAEALDPASLLVASAASRIWVPETAQVFLVGLRMDTYHLRGLLDKLRIEADVVRIGSHKTAGERLTRTRMSSEEREQLEALAGDLYDALIEGIAHGRGLDAESVRGIVDRGPYDGKTACEAGLVNRCLYPDELDEALLEVAPPRAGPRRVDYVDAVLYHSLRARDAGWQPLRSALPRLAYVVAQGNVHRGRGVSGIGSHGLGALFARLGADEVVRGVVLRIESPGGDALASDLLWRSVSQLRREKPVVASLGEVAASGGYYLAAGADAVHAEAGSLTGSIGVVGGKLDLSELYRRVGIGRDGVERGARAGMLSDSRPLRGDERRALRGEMARRYSVFVDRVARGRGLEAPAVERAAQGRVWSGTRALGLGLIDALGGPLEALGDVRRRAGLRAGEPALLEIHPRLPTLRALLRVLR